MPQQNCKNCGKTFDGNFCNHCGEKVYTEKDKHVTHFFEEGLHFITHFEGKFFTTLKTIFTAPGKLSFDYSNGIRKKYFKPLSFFLMLVILYLLLPVFDGLNISMEQHTKRQYGEFAALKIEQKINSTAFTREHLAELFDEKSSKVSKPLLLIIIPLTALFTWLLTFKKRKLFFDQLVISTEINIVFLLWGFLLLPLIFLLYASLTGYTQFNDELITYLIYIPLLAYCYIAFTRFYQLKWWQGILLCLTIYFVHRLVVFTVYRFILFNIVINQIH